MDGAYYMVLRGSEGCAQHGLTLAWQFVVHSYSCRMHRLGEMPWPRNCLAAVLAFIKGGDVVSDLVGHLLV